MQCMSASFLSLITIGALIAVAGFFIMGKILAGTDTIPTVAAVIGRSTGVGKGVFFRFFFHIRFTSPEVTVRFVHSNLLIHF